MPNPNAVVSRLAQLAQLGKYDGGIDRPLASPQERAARDLFAAWARGAGRALSQDRAGNLFARRAGASNGDSILVGSHLDTVPTGGAYDGAYGVVGALCALEELDARRARISRPIEAVAWAGEEGSRFPLGCLGSSVFSGLTDLETALRLSDENAIAFGDALADARGGLLPGIAQRIAGSVAAYLELHVEQGPVLESAGASLGVVTAIAGQRRYRATVEGTSGHAGTVPMRARSDALSATSEIVLAMESAARQADEVVVTVGKVCVEPGGTNVIPRRVVFSIDARSPDDALIHAVESAFHQAAHIAQKRRGVRVGLDTLERRPPTPMDPAMRQAVWNAVRPLDSRALDVTSGAGHDAMCLARIAPAAMIFVPSIGGRSHVGDERTEDADLELGVRALADALVEVDTMLASK